MKTLIKHTVTVTACLSMQCPSSYKQIKWWGENGHSYYEIWAWLQFNKGNFSTYVYKTAAFKIL